MADNSMENLISNYGDMSIEELGSSLLQRQSDIAAQRAKEAKKNSRNTNREHRSSNKCDNTINYK